MKHFLYLKYIIRHKWFVFVECCKLGIPFRGLVHDWSKFLPSEWGPYAEHFYGVSKNESDFDAAWLYHQHRNPHHWQYWVLREDSGNWFCIRMPHKYRLELLADLNGTGLAKTGKNDTREYYAENGNNMFLHPDTRKWIEANL